MLCLPWYGLSGVKNNSLKKSARYADEKPRRPDLPNRLELETNSRRFSTKYLLGVMNSAIVRNVLRSNRRSNTDLYPEDWKQLPIPDVPGNKQKAIISVVDRILNAKRANSDADLSALEAELDAQVDVLYRPTGPSADNAKIAI